MATTPAVRPTVSVFTRALYRRLPRFLRTADEGQGWPLLTYLALLGDQAEVLASVIRDGPARLGDPGSADVRALPWLARLAGVDPTLYPDPAGARAQLRTAIAGADANRAAGSTGAVLAAVRPLLTGTRVAAVVERNPAAFSYAVATYAAQTPDPVALARVLAATRPAGLVVTHRLLAGQDFHEGIEYGQTFGDWRSGAFAPATGPTFGDLLRAIPDASTERTFGAGAAGTFEVAAGNTFARFLRPLAGRDKATTVATYNRVARRTFATVASGKTFLTLSTEPS